MIQKVHTIFKKLIMDGPSKPFDQQRRNEHGATTYNLLWAFSECLHDVGLGRGYLVKRRTISFDHKMGEGRAFIFLDFCASRDFGIQNCKSRDPGKFPGILNSLELLYCDQNIIGKSAYFSCN